MMNRFGKWIVFFVMLLVLVPYTLAGAAAGDKAQIQNKKGETVTIYRDNFGVPHIYADTEGALFFGWGYAIAQDRLYQLEYMKRVAAGTFAEVFGPGLLAYDIGQRTFLRPDDWYEKSFQALGPYHQRIWQAYVDGVNYYIAEAKKNPSKMPIEFGLFGIELKPLTTIDVLKIGVYLASYWGAEGGHELENRALYDSLIKKYGAEKARIIFDDVLPPYDAESFTSLPAGYPWGLPANNAADKTTPKYYAYANHPGAGTNPLPEIRPEIIKRKAERMERFALMRPARSTHASHATALGPKKTANGKLLMSMCTADGAEVHLSGAGYEVAGYNFPGSFSFGSGRTRNFVFQQTVGESDVIDTYVETLNPKNQYQYFYKGKWRDMERRTEIIKIKGSAPYELEVFRTVHGHVFDWDIANGVAYALKFAGLELPVSEPMTDMYRAQNFAQFEKAMGNMPYNDNVVYGDVDGNIAYMHFGLHPVRPAHVDPRLPSRGTGEDEWLGYIPSHKLPHVKNPDQGWLMSWNNQPARDWPAGDCARWGKTFHIYKPVELVEAEDSFTWEKLHQYHYNTAKAWGHIEWGSATNKIFFTPFLRKAADESGNQKIKDAVTYLEQWNGLYIDSDNDKFYDSVGLTIWRKWLDLAIKRVLGDEIGDTDIRWGYDRALFLRALEGADAKTPFAWDFFNGENKNTVINETLDTAIAELTAQYGSDMSTWKTPIFWRTFNDDMMGILPYLGILKPVPLSGAAEYTHFVELGGGVVTRMETIIPSGGQCWFVGPDMIPSPHASDQYLMHANFQYKPMHFELPDILANLESVEQLTYTPSK